MFPYRRVLYGDLENADILLAILILVGLIAVIKITGFIYRKIKKNKSIEETLTDLSITDKTQSE